jgi:hypothetical protein
MASYVLTVKIQTNKQTHELPKQYFQFFDFTEYIEKINHSKKKNNKQSQLFACGNIKLYIMFTSAIFVRTYSHLIYISFIKSVNV